MKGKHGQAATTRRSAADREAQEAAYQRQIVTLSEEVRTLRASLETEQRSRSAERRLLRAQLAEGLAPEIKAKDAIINQLTGRLGRSHGMLVSAEKKSRGLAQALAGLLMSDKGMTWREAISWIVKEVNVSPEMLDLRELASGGQRSSSEMNQIRGVLAVEGATYLADTQVRR